jgi:hypothetical protein
MVLENGSRNICYSIGRGWPVCMDAKNPEWDKPIDELLLHRMRRKQLSDMFYICFRKETDLDKSRENVYIA